MIRSIIVLTALTFLFSSNLSSQFRLDKIGASSSIDRLITTYGKESRGTLKSKISMRTSIGGRLNFVLPGRLGLTTGINLSRHLLEGRWH